MQLLLEFVLETHVFEAYEGWRYQDFVLGLLRSICSRTRLCRDPADNKSWRIISRRSQELFKCIEDVNEDIAAPATRPEILCKPPNPDRELNLGPKIKPILAYYRKALLKEKLCCGFISRTANPEHLQGDRTCMWEPRYKGREELVSAGIRAGLKCDTGHHWQRAEQWFRTQNQSCVSCPDINGLFVV